MPDSQGGNRMTGIFRLATDVDREKIEWGVRAWFSLPASTGTKNLVVVEVNLMPGFGHNFHIHPNQEEIIYVLQGELEQWLEQEKRSLNPGDTVFINKNTVHASFNVSNQPIKLLAILGPAIGEEGYELVDVSAESPWNSLRNPG
jgi:quercetin dioxygenase-like cupin family protein